MSRIAQPIVWIACLASLAVVAQAAVAESKDHPYEVILTRNAFGLKPVPVVEPAKPDEGPPPNIKLTGLIGITIPKKATLVVTPAGKGNPLYLTVNEGEYSEDSLLQVVLRMATRGSSSRWITTTLKVPAPCGSPGKSPLRRRVYISQQFCDALQIIIGGGAERRVCTRPGPSQVGPRP